MVRIPRFHTTPSGCKCWKQDEKTVLPVLASSVCGTCKGKPATDGFQKTQACHVASIDYLYGSDLQ
jgi:hypothetical protein